jgi:hypothetical protein
MGLCVLRCSVSTEPERAPFGYDRTFDYFSIVKSSPGYAHERDDGYPRFSYRNPADENLMTLRTRYDLEAVARGGDELSRILAVLRWAHRSLRHDGGRRVETENALRILQDRDATGGGVNCVIMAIVLNETDLALGLESRVVHGNGRDWVFYLPEGVTRSYVHLDLGGDQQDGLGRPMSTNYFTRNPDYSWGTPPLRE